MASKTVEIHKTQFFSNLFEKYSRIVTLRFAKCCCLLYFNKLFSRKFPAIIIYGCSEMNVLSTFKWMKWKGVKLVQKEIKTRELIFPLSGRHGIVGVNFRWQSSSVKKIKIKVNCQNFTARCLCLKPYLPVFFFCQNKFVKSGIYSGRRVNV